MRFPWSKSPQAVKAAEQPRTESGKFASPNPAQPRTESVVKQIQAESQAMSGTVQVIEGASKLFEVVDGLAQKKAEAMLQTEEQAEFIGSEWAQPATLALQIFGPALTPYIPGIMEKLGIQPSVQPNVEAISTPNQPAVESQGSQPVLVHQFDGITLIKNAAKSPPSIIKVAMKAQGYNELERVGITKEEFKQAISNIHKAIQ